jgi:hypothetical protein
MDISNNSILFNKLNIKIADISLFVHILNDFTVRHCKLCTNIQGRWKSLRQQWIKSARHDGFQVFTIEGAQLFKHH